MLAFQRLAHLMYWLLLFVLVHLWDFVATLRIFLAALCCDRTVLLTDSDQLADKAKPNSPPPPHHLAFQLDDRRYANEEFVGALVRHCARAGIGRLTLSDDDKLGTVAKKRRISENDDDDQHQIVVRRLASSEGREEIVRACKKLSMSNSPVTVDQLNNVLADSADQPDFLVRVGPPFWRSVTLATNTPLAIRTTEFHCVAGFSSDRTLSDREFCALLAPFSARNRRFGL